MPDTFNDRLHTIIQKHIGSAVESAVREAIDAYRSFLTSALGDDKPAPHRGPAPKPAAAAKVPAKGRKKRSSAFGAKMSALLKNRPCPFPGCTNKTCGPRFRFFCAVHSKLPKGEQIRLAAAAKAKGSAAAPAVAAKKPVAKAPPARKAAPKQAAPKKKKASKKKVKAAKK